jgi:hypothetical protein
MVSAVLSAHAYIFLVIVCAAFLVAIGWTVHSLFYRDQFADPAPMRAPQISYMRDVRQRELQQLLASNDNTTGRNEENFHDQFIEDCTYPGLMVRDATYGSLFKLEGPSLCNTALAALWKRVLTVDLFSVHRRFSFQLFEC